jgi:pyridoxine kinase
MSATQWPPSACRRSAARSLLFTLSTTVSLPKIRNHPSINTKPNNPTGNHVAYKRFNGRKSTPSEVAALYAGLKNARLDDFDMLLSGYCPSAALVQEVGKIGRELRQKASPGKFFWVLDPVMGDNGRIYVAEDTIPVYKDLLKDADLILPNQFEAELLSDVKITDLRSMHAAIETLHARYQIPHVLITSIRLPASTSTTPSTVEQDLSATARLSVVGSTRTSDNKPRLFSITVPSLPIFFSGTGDMFAALMVSRLRQEASLANLLETSSWRSPDEVSPQDLPLAKAAEKVLASMHAVLKDTAAKYEREVAAIASEKAEGTDEEIETTRHLRLTKAAEVRVVRNAKLLREPPALEGFGAKAVLLDGEGL